VYLVRLSGLLSGRARLFAVCAHHELAQQLAANRVEVLCLPTPFGRGVQRFLKYPMLLLAALWLALRHRVHAVHISGYQSAFLLAPLRLAGCRAFITPHHLPRGAVALRGYVAGARWAHGVVNVSATVDQEHRALLPSVPSQVVPNWIPLLPPRMPPRAMRPARRVLFVGRLAANKGLPDLLQAIRLLAGEVGLLVAGEGPMRAEFERLASGLPVEFCGYHPDLTRLYADADALIVPSHGPEGSCLVALEAMAHGLPCALSDLPVYREIALDGKAALLFPAGDAPAIAAAVRSLIADRSLGAQLASAAFHMIRDRYSQEAASLIYFRTFGVAATPCRK